MLDPVIMRGQTFERRWKHLLFVSTRFFVVPLLRITLRVRIHGLGNIPRRGGALLICNHLNWFDPIMLLACSPRPILFMAKSEAFEIPVLSWFARQAGAFPVKRGRADRAALKHAETRLSEGMLVGMFPEGTRSRTGGLIQAQAGVSMVALRSGAPIIPCALIGMQQLPMSGKRQKMGRYPQVTAIYGVPFHLKLDKPDGGRFSFDDLTDAMLIEMARLLPPDLRGAYVERAHEVHPAVDRSRVQFTGPHAPRAEALHVTRAAPGRLARLRTRIAGALHGLRPSRRQSGTAHRTDRHTDTHSDTGAGAGTGTGTGRNGSAAA